MRQLGKGHKGAVTGAVKQSCTQWRCLFSLGCKGNLLFTPHGSDPIVCAVYQYFFRKIFVFFLCLHHEVPVFVERKATNYISYALIGVLNCLLLYMLNQQVPQFQLF